MAPELPLYVRLRGSHEPPAERRVVRAGPLTAVCEEGDLRWIRLGEREIVRRIYVAVRDRNWGTVPARITDRRLAIGPDSFALSYQAEHRQDEITFVWRATVSGDAHGTIRFAMDGVARTTFLRNRIGFCVLHPADCAGVGCMVTHGDGAVERGSFPQLIAADQPFLDIGAITYEAAPGTLVELRFDGDSFEMEDQRNWSDASFKTYCTPLSLPYPVEIAAGTTVRQQVTLSLRTADTPAGQPASPQPGAIRPAPAGVPARQPSLALLPGAAPLPQLGLCVAAEDDPPSPTAAARLRALRLSHLRADVHLAAPAWEAALQRAAHDAGLLGLPLELALHVGAAPEQELELMRAALERLRPAVRRYLLFQEGQLATPAALLPLARAALSSYAAQAAFGAGTDAYFAELNRERPDPSAVDLLCYSINPQVHAFDDASLVENLAAQAATVASARAFAGGRPLCVGPVTLRMRYNPDATGPEPPLPPGSLPRNVDPRQLSLFGAGWTLGSIKYLAEAGAHSITSYETTGWRGVIEREPGSPLPERFPSLPGAVFPLYHVLADIAEVAGGEVLATAASDPLAFEGLALRSAGRLRVLLASFDAAPQTVRVAPLAGRLRLRTLDADSAETAMRDPEGYRARPGAVQEADGELLVDLPPYAVVTIDQLPA